MHQILLIADRKTTVDSLQENIDSGTFRFLVASNQRTALSLAKHRAPDVVIVDNTSGRLCGSKLTQSLRRVLDAPLIAIVREQGEAVDMGATDSLIKPYTARQLSQAVQRALNYPRELRAGKLQLDLRTREVSAPHLNTPHPLTPKLFALLRTLMREKGSCVSRETLMAEVWHTDFMEDTRTLDVHIRWIREIIEPDPSNPHYLQTIRGTGYCLIAHGNHSRNDRQPPHQN